jgi:pimeloyl-ACP methyl ester carboxylesterase
VRRLLPTHDGESVHNQVHCIPGGRILLLRPGAGTNRLVLVEPTTTGLVEQTLVTVEGSGLRLIGNPDPGTLAIAIGPTDYGRSAVWRVLPASPWLECVAQLPGMLLGGNWLDGVGRRLGVNQRNEGASKPIEVDLRDGSARPIAGTSPGQHLVLSAPSSGLLLLAGPVEGALRLGHGLADGSRPPRFPDGLQAIKGVATPIAVDPSGEHVALRMDRGARSHLLIYTPRLERVREVDVPAGIMGGTGNWSVCGLRFPLSTPTQPGGIATVVEGRTQPGGTATVVEGSTSPDGVSTRWGLATFHGDDEPRWADARVHEFAGPAGPIEAVVYGRDDWRHAQHLLVALHGGPEAATQLTFDPLSQTLVGAGIAIVAPNYRGSTGYGLPHRQALNGAWGGPDLADVRHLARELSRQRRVSGSLMVYGTSYGAFLALLAASADPGLWSHCAAVAPFVSGLSLYEDGSPRVRALLDRLGGRAAIDDDLGPRDLARLCGRITARLLIIHGRDDEVIPVSQSRALRECLLRAGRQEGPDFTYLEPPTGGHYPIGGANGAELADRLIRFLLGGLTRP